MAVNQNPQQRVMPTLRMTDYARSKQFYVDGLGFQVDWEHRFEPTFPVFAQVSRDGMAFFLTEQAAARFKYENDSLRYLSTSAFVLTDWGPRSSDMSAVIGSPRMLAATR